MAAPPAEITERLVDPFGRHITYVRLSVTDRCELRCVYCMTEDMQFLPRSQLLTLEELARLGGCFSGLGVVKLRVTGGEPLVRRNILWLLERLGALPGISDLGLTTNGSQLARYAADLAAAGVTRLNVSLDTLKPERFRAITRLGQLARTLAGIDAALGAGFRRIKINSVILRDRNHDEVADLVAYALDRGIDISFIEEMPLGFVDQHDRAETYYPSDQIRRDLADRFELIPTTESTGGPSKYYRIASEASRIGFISPRSHNFCGDCNRVRVSAEGRLLLCLGQEHSADLRHALRANPGDDDAVKRAIAAAIATKPRGHDFNLTAKPVIVRHMSATGG